MVKHTQYLLRVTRGGSDEAVKMFNVEVSDQFSVAKASSQELLMMVKGLLAQHLQPLEAEQGPFACAGCDAPATIFNDMALRYRLGDTEGVLHCVYAICCHAQCEQSAEAVLKIVTSAAVHSLGNLMQA